MMVLVGAFAFVPMVSVNAAEGVAEVKSEQDLIMEVQEGPEPISYDDVIDAHRFIKNLDGNWHKHLPKCD